MSSSKTKPKKIRRTNEERTAQTRGRLIDATIELLYEGGSAATTTISVAERAGVSRGAMMHHFRSRAELLLVVARFILDEQRRERVEKLANAGHGLDRFYAAADVSWAVHRQPSTVAFLEIIMATRSDPDLRKGMQPLIELIPQMRKQAAERMAADLPTQDVVKINHLLRLHQAALRGLAIELMFSRDEADIEATRGLLVQYERDFVQKIVRPNKRKRAK
ncbi:MAG TPA: helix-turn-helix domain-containing protein [Steroidobacteraceae bacterium]|nr:helix-turn-helix domain-containing protein [Steroidobacteraceae bacterium]